MSSGRLKSESADRENKGKLVGEREGERINISSLKETSREREKCLFGKKPCFFYTCVTAAGSTLSHHVINNYFLLTFTHSLFSIAEREESDHEVERLASIGKSLCVFLTFLWNYICIYFVLCVYCIAHLKK